MGAPEAMLVVLLWKATTSTFSERRYDFPNMQECQQAIQRAVTDVSDGGDSEGGAVLFCAPYDERGAALSVAEKYRGSAE